MGQRGGLERALSNVAGNCVPWWAGGSEGGSACPGRFLCACTHRALLCSDFPAGKAARRSPGAGGSTADGGSRQPTVPFAFCSPRGNPTALGSLQRGLPHRQQPAPAPVAVLGQILLPGPHIPTKRCPAARAAPPGSRWNDPRGVLPQGLGTQPLHPGHSQPCATVAAHLQVEISTGFAPVWAELPLGPSQAAVGAAGEAVPLFPAAYSRPVSSGTAHAWLPAAPAWNKSPCSQDRHEVIRS